MKLKREARERERERGIRWRAQWSVRDGVEHGKTLYKNYKKVSELSFSLHHSGKCPFILYRFYFEKECVCGAMHLLKQVFKVQVTTYRKM